VVPGGEPEKVPPIGRVLEEGEEVEARPVLDDLTDWMIRGENAYFSRSNFELGRGPLSLEPLVWKENPATAGPAIFERIIVVPGFEKDAWGLDVVSGKHLWTFRTVPQPGEFGYDTWDRPENYGANCWSGMDIPPHKQT
jgi:hypothetical protein